MNTLLRRHAEDIVRHAIDSVVPDSAVKSALAHTSLTGRVFLVAAGKAAWQMAKAACSCLENRIERGVVVTKYGHVMGSLPNVHCYEAGHPIPDENSFVGTAKALELVSDLHEEDTVLFLLSGGGSALFEKPLITAGELQSITNQLLACGADIVEMNIIRKRLSEVKGGRFAKLCEPAHVFAVILSDVLGDSLDMIASGPVSVDKSTCIQALDIVNKYELELSDEAMSCLMTDLPKEISNVTVNITGSVKQLCMAAAEKARELGYTPTILTDQLCCQAKEAGSFLASVLKSHATTPRPLAFIAGGETVVKLTGTGMGGRNQELALAAAAGLDGIDNAAIISVGSDGTDGPTDAAGGYSDGKTAEKLRRQGVSIHQVLLDNDTYYALKSIDGLIITGPTGTNVNDVSVGLINNCIK